ncbi:hypothetical protein [Serratia nematodiphila]|uniref:hypothetical protein n=1 Tax=Serratia nematodiphila TaxID=458197 RepID=UPI0011D2FA7E|nr:hypothetical protein [Serratia nematodiphila]TXE56390.1 hypothetical protein FOT58_21170 [Serratia nematodiphila]
MEDLIRDIMKIYKDADNAFSYCAMNFDKRIEVINEWNRLLCPENVMILLNSIEEKDIEILKLTEENELLQEQVN